MHKHFYLAAASAVLAAAPALALSTDAEFLALRRNHHAVALETLARERVAKDPVDDVALWHWGRLVVGDARQRDELVQRLERCVKDLPQSARCHHALGSAYGAVAASAGMSAGLKLAGSVKDMYVKAVELDPRHFEMRRDLNQFYLHAPGFVGGSVRKALDNSAEFAKIDAHKASILRADIHLYEKQYDMAEALLNGITAAKDAELSDAVRAAHFRLGLALIEGGDAGRAQRIFERQITQDARDANAHLGLGRALLEQKAWDAAIAAFERALQLDPASRVHYRLALAYQGQGDKLRATKNFQQFLLYAPQGKAADEARKRLDEMRT
jgi:tetratricopeptide (TPR) repeat protein